MDVFTNPGPIVGREAELGALEAALSGLGEGQAGFLSFEGEPGIGKTRLLRELRERAAKGSDTRCLMRSRPSSARQP